MKFEIIREHTELLIPLSDGTLPLLEVFKIAGSRESGKYFENFWWDHFKIQINKYDKSKPLEASCDFHQFLTITLEVAADSTFMCPGGHCDVSVWEDYTVADYWGGNRWDESLDDVYIYLDKIGFIKILHEN